jgi:hypothetical protein
MDQDQNDETLKLFSVRRTLTFKIQDRISLGELFIGDIHFFEPKMKWACHWAISFINPEISRMYGRDPLDALLTTCDFVSSLIRGSERDGLHLWWQTEGDYGGMFFPLVESKNWENLKL